MIFSRYGTFRGGIDLPDEKHRTIGKPIRPVAPMDRLRVPLGFREQVADPVVHPGQRVRADQLLARAAGAWTTDVFAPLGGKVERLTTADIQGDARFVSVPAIELTDLEAPRALPHDPARHQWENLSADQLRRKLLEGGIVICHRWPRPLDQWLGRAISAGVHTVIANVMEGQPFVSTDHRLLVEHGPEVVEGLTMVAKAIGAQRALLAVDRRRTDQYAELQSHAESFPITHLALPHKYPTGADSVLVKVLTRKEVPINGSYFDVGAVVLNAATCLAIYQWVACEVRQTHRVVTVDGQGIAEPGNYFVPFGMRCLDLLGDVAGTLIHGGPMVGLPLTESAIVAPATDAVLQLRPAPVPLPAPCLRCGWCSDHCPARLNVAALNDDFELAMFDQADLDGAEACVECGICSYVCPARLPLSQRVKQLKRAVTLRRRHRERTGDPT